MASEAAAPTLTYMLPLASAQERDTLLDLYAKQGLLRHMPERDQHKWGARIDRLVGTLFYQIVDSSAARLRAVAETAG